MVEYTERELNLATNLLRTRRQLAYLQQTAFGGQRRYSDVLGYERDIGLDTFELWYQRGGIARTLVALPAEDTWKRAPVISEGDTVTAFTTAWEQLATRLRVWSALTRADRISGIGHYGGLIIGTTLADGETCADPLQAGALNGPGDVLYLRPFKEADVSSIKLGSDSADPRYLLPLSYSIDVSGDDQRGTQAFHWTRVLHIAEGRDSSEVDGTPRLQAVFNRLYDLLKVVGGMGEALWYRMRPGTVIKPATAGDVSYQITTSEDDIDSAVQKFADDPMRMMVLPFSGIDIENLNAPGMPDISNYIERLIDLISATARIPKRRLMGSAAGQLASAREDARQWAGTIATRQSTYAEPDILRPLIDRLIWAGALPAPQSGHYDVGTLDQDADEYRWPSIIDMTDLERAQIRQAEATARQTLARDALTTPITSSTEDRELLGLPPVETATPEPPPPAVNQHAGHAHEFVWNQAEPFVPTTGTEDIDAALQQYGADMGALVNRAVEGDLEQDGFEDELTVLVAAIALLLYRRASGKTAAEMTDADWLEIQQYSQVNLEAIERLSADIYDRELFVDADGAVKETALAARISLWLISALALVNLANLRGHPGDNFRWDLGGTIEHCADCLRLDGQVHSAEEWLRSGWLPQTRVLECGGWNCDCVLRRTRAARRGSF